MTDPGLLVAARVGRPHGLDGSFHALEADARLLGVGARVEVDGAETEVVGRKGTDDRPIVRLALASTREDVDALRGRALHVRRVAAPALAADEYWAADLEGCLVVAGARELGVVERLVAFPSCEALAVGDLLVPLVRDAVRAIDLGARRIEVDAGFLGIEG